MKIRFIDTGKLWLIVAALCLASNISEAGWIKNSRVSGVYDQSFKGKQIARYLNAPHYAQPTNYTCGSTTMSMQMRWETQKKGRPLGYNILSIHKNVNTVGGSTSGLTTVELKNGIAKFVNRVNQTRRLGLKVYMQERKEKSIKSAVGILARTIARNFSPAIIYGNVKYAAAGGHYLLATGVMYCPKGTCSNDVIGLYVNDSAYSSPAYSPSHPVRKLAISPRKYINHRELESYWKPTGSRYPWQKGHMYLYNRSTSI